VWSRDEWDADGEVRLRRVLRRFERFAGVVNLHAGGRVIGTTHEHPFFAEGKGWTAAHELQIGDRIRLRGPGWVTVDGVADSGQTTVVYNIEVEDDHTYFVGGAGWEFSLWAHNSDGYIRLESGRLKPGAGMKFHDAPSKANLANKSLVSGTTELQNAGLTRVQTWRRLGLH